MKQLLVNLNERIQTLIVAICIIRDCLVLRRSQKEKLEYTMYLSAHSLEKGMSLKNVKKNFGIRKAENLFLAVNQWVKKNYDINQYIFRESVAVLDKYLSFQTSMGTPQIELSNSFKEFMRKQNLQNVEDLKVGCYSISNEEIGKKKDFLDIICSRHSVREFKKEKISEEIIEKAVLYARCAPSACNRQPEKVYYALKEDVINKIATIVPGNRGFEEEIENYLVITSNRAYFGAREYGQWWVNGGEFIAYLQLILHYMKIGSCQFQWPLKDEKGIRKLLHISRNECIIGVLGIGKYKDNFNVIGAARKNIDEILFRYRCNE